MNVQDTLHIGELQKGVVIAGVQGINRNVNYVEVMEVPEVSDWITPGVLVMTAFYSIKDEPEKQIKVVKDLINIKASGIVIKLGRFIEELPKQVIDMANENDFPIISIPKDVSYIKILTPLYEKIYNEKRKKEDFILNPLLEIGNSNLISIPEILNKMKDIVKSNIYIEDLEGRLLYASEGFLSDGWRKSTTIFSLPDYPSFREIIQSWTEDFLQTGFSVFKIHGFRNRLLIPLTSQNQVFAIMHVPYTNDFMFDKSSRISELSNKFSKLFLSDQLFLQRERLDDVKLMDRLFQKLESANSNKVISIVQFEASWLAIFDYSSSYLIDYTSLVRRKLIDIVNQISHSEVVLFEKHNSFFALIFGDEKSYPEMLDQWSLIIKKQNEKEANENIRIAISPYMKTPTSFIESLNSVRKTMEIGMKIKPRESVYTFDKLGIYEILIKLTNDKFSVKYARNLLNPLENDQGELLKTLKVYLDENGNVTRSSESLFIHRRTMTYRIKRIEELLNMDLDDSMNRFILRFCLMLKDLS
ncbi:PucR family transcriptional regulator [Ornithinibacillus halotolerans]|uniref:Purine catabolism regulatory protein n=1 Tax=Ornithinibacillus halotolerans TaxID=1274357 RepID=A0A916SA47_9BACI|nr:PucR family transcriptional regulator ligand-binding domain-containing protein [Ornithinibacillus halotolerans]GGA91371.1 purine catabolism regulatory protein [Ornithinibacillus halotolerans]